MKLLIHSKNKETINLIKNVLKPPFKGDFVNDESLDNLKNFQALLIDTTDQKTALSFPKEYTGAVNNSKIPVILLIEESQINSLYNCGILLDDFLLKKQIYSELNLRIKLVLLNKRGISLKNSIIVNELILNLDKYELLINKKPIELTFKEYELLKLLLKNQDRVFTREKLLSDIWEYDYYGGSRTVDVHIRRLRSKLPSPYHLMIKTIRNVGYMFSAKS